MTEGWDPPPAVDLDVEGADPTGNAARAAARAANSDAANSAADVAAKGDDSAGWSSDGDVVFSLALAFPLALGTDFNLDSDSTRHCSSFAQR